jgi:signal peptidase II
VIEVFPPFLVFRLGYNTGINFGLMAGGPEVTRWIAGGHRPGDLGMAPVVGADGADPAHGADFGGRGDRRGAVERARQGHDRAPSSTFSTCPAAGSSNPFAFNVADIGIVAGAIGC